MSTNKTTFIQKIQKVLLIILFFPKILWLIFFRKDKNRKTVFNKYVEDRDARHIKVNFEGISTGGIVDFIETSMLQLGRFSTYQVKYSDAEDLYILTRLAVGPESESKHEYRIVEARVQGIKNQGPKADFALVQAIFAWLSPVSFEYSLFYYVPKTDIFFFGRSHNEYSEKQGYFEVNRDFFTRFGNEYAPGLKVDFNEKAYFVSLGNYDEIKEITVSEIPVTETHTYIDFYLKFLQTNSETILGHSKHIKSSIWGYSAESISPIKVASLEDNHAVQYEDVDLNILQPQYGKQPIYRVEAESKDSKLTIEVLRGYLKSHHELLSHFCIFLSAYSLIEGNGYIMRFFGEEVDYEDSLESISLKNRIAVLKPSK